MLALAEALWLSVLLGVFLGGVYDALRIQRIFLGVCYAKKRSLRLQAIRLPLISKKENVKPSTRGRAHQIVLEIFIFFGDVLFFVFAALLCTVLLYHTNDGKIRGMVFFGMAAGFAMYYFTLGRLVIAFSEYIVFFLRCVFLYLRFFLLWPFARAYSFLKRLAEVYAARAYTKRELERTVKASKVGFIG